jgi:hypothetical protein
MRESGRLWEFEASKTDKSPSRIIVPHHPLSMDEHHLLSMDEHHLLSMDEHHPLSMDEHHPLSMDEGKVTNESARPGVSNRQCKHGRLWKDSEGDKNQTGECGYGKSPP